MLTKYKRLWQSLRLMTIRSGFKRTRYLKKRAIFRQLGDNCMLQLTRIPLYAGLIRIHNNVRIASDVTFVTHDVIHSMLNQSFSTDEFQETLGCIDIRDNVFIGSHSIIMYGVRIGPNAVVAAGSVVTRDVPPHSVVAGIPARPVSSFEALAEKRRQNHYPPAMKPQKQRLTSELEDWMWEDFDRSRSLPLHGPIVDQPEDAI